LVFLNETHDVLGEPGGVFGHHESYVAAVDLLVMNHGFLIHSISNPSCICNVGQLVVLPSEDCNGHFSNVFNRDQVSLTLGIKDVIIVKRPDLESILSNTLGVVK
jgi:hypothetical protein